MNNKCDIENLEIKDLRQVIDFYEGQFYEQQQTKLNIFLWDFIYKDPIVTSYSSNLSSSKVTANIMPRILLWVNEVTTLDAFKLEITKMDIRDYQAVIFYEDSIVSKRRYKTLEELIRNVFEHFKQQYEVSDISEKELSNTLEKNPYDLMHSSLTIESLYLIFTDLNDKNKVIKKKVA